MGLGTTAVAETMVAAADGGIREKKKKRREVGLVVETEKGVERKGTRKTKQETLSEKKEN